LPKLRCFWHLPQDKRSGKKSKKGAEKFS